MWFPHYSDFLCAIKLLFREFQMQSGNQNLFSLANDGSARILVTSLAVATSPSPPQLIGDVALSIVLRCAAVRLRCRAVEMELRSNAQPRQGIEPR